MLGVYITLIKRHVGLLEVLKILTLWFKDRQKIDQIGQLLTVPKEGVSK